MFNLCKVKMASSSTFNIFLLVIVAYLSIAIATPASPGTSQIWLEDHSTHDPSTHEAEKVPQFNYLEVDAWGSKHPSFAACAKGKRQSPIDINTYEIVLNETLQPLERDYRVGNASLCTEGTQIEVLFAGSSGGLEIDGKMYKLAQFHIHTPSEHLFNGVQYAAELHQVHTADDGSHAVVAVLFKHGPPSPFIRMMMPQVQELSKKPCNTHHCSSVLPTFKSKSLRKWPRNYYRYQGSLTTPPCDENVIWSILTEVKTISREQVEALRVPLCEEDKKNARPAQPINDRKVQKYDKN